MIKKIIFSTLLIFLALLLLIFIVYIYPQSILANKVKNLIPYETKNNITKILKQTIFFIPELKQKTDLANSNLEFMKSKIDYLEKKLNKTIKILSESDMRMNTSEIYSKEIMTNDNLHLGLKKYSLPLNPHSGKKGKAYVDHTENNIFITRTSGEIFFISKKNIKKNPQISRLKTNLTSMIFDENFFDKYTLTKYGAYVGIKDILIHKNQLYLTYLNKVKNDCYNIAILSAEINLDYLKFTNFFKHTECVVTDSKESDYGNGRNLFIAGGRIIAYNNGENILLTTGDLMNRPLAQNDESMFGKIISINITNKSYKVFAKGFRNPQGLFYSKKFNKIIETEHGPSGGDEINIINQNNNYGWPIASYGEHMTYPENHLLSSKERQSQAPLYNSHNKYNFVEPVFTFLSAIAPSEIIEIPKQFSEEIGDSYFLTSLKAGSLFNIKFNNNFTGVESIKQIRIGERIRDIVYDKKINVFYLIFENSRSIGILSNSKIPYKDCVKQRKFFEKQIRLDQINKKIEKEINNFCKNKIYSPNNNPVQNITNLKIKANMTYGNLPTKNYNN